MLSRWTIRRGRSGGVPLKCVVTSSRRSRNATAASRSQPPTNRIDETAAFRSPPLARTTSGRDVVLAGHDDGEPVGIGPVERRRDRLRHLDRRPAEPFVDGALDAHAEDPARERELLDPAAAHGREADEPVVAEPVVDADGNRANRRIRDE